uniref:Uncharacterized protein LOC111124407 n=1 Tax=Crassostrea virginica TaxID=6565 RepID=A0A8B8D4A2_CRAVI|nr:uncharacterized protein LOC111124407 [Crassostrea virginica]
MKTVYFKIFISALPVGLKIYECRQVKIEDIQENEEYSVLFGLLGLIGSCFALECYVCLAQRTNKDKCIKTTIQCEKEQDACKTQIRWQQPRFWQRVSERYHNISKSCETKARCDAEAAEKGFKCMRDWYRDWDCVECCQGDRCNYYATLGAVRLSSVSAC